MFTAAVPEGVMGDEGEKEHAAWLGRPDVHVRAVCGRRVAEGYQARSDDTGIHLSHARQARCSPRKHVLSRLGQGSGCLHEAPRLEHRGTWGTHACGQLVL